MNTKNIETDIKESNIDYLNMINEYGLNDIDIRACIKSKEFEEKVGKVIPEKTNKYIISKSKIEGKGIFCCFDFYKNDVLGFAIKNGNRTLLGRYTNHSSKNNAIFHTEKNGDMIAILIKDIKKGEEILVNYRNHGH